MLKEWFKEGLSHNNVAKLSSANGQSVIYKGFRIFYDSELREYSIKDVRYSEFYSDVKEEDYRILLSNGFIKGCQIIMMIRDRLRVSQYSKKLEKLYKNKSEYVKNKDVKRLRVCNKNITTYIDLLFFYKSRLNQLESK